MKYTLLLLIPLILAACSNANKKEESPLSEGRWTMVFDISDSTRWAAIPVRFTVNEKGHFTLVNGEEEIQLTHWERKGDTLVAKIEPYLSSLHYVIKDRKNIVGYWQDEAREDYKIPFTAAPSLPSSASDIEWKDIVYDATFSYDCIDCAYKAVGVFNADNGVMTGTFLTETGDYRFLQGETYRNGNFYLSCFDGAHLFHFTGTVAGDSIVNGRFSSGKHHSELWNARKDANVQLRDPDSLTYLKPGTEEFVFHVRNMKGDSVIFDNDSFQNKVTIVQILGTWCPNCTDETQFWKKATAELGPGIQVIPVAFERGDSFEKHLNAVTNYKKQFQLPYEVYIGGQLSKGNAAQVFSGLNTIMSFPTSVILDKKGKVRSIHTGFYGPSTGKYHRLYTERLRMQIEALLKEQ